MSHISYKKGLFCTLEVNFFFSQRLILDLKLMFIDLNWKVGPLWLYENFQILFLPINRVINKREWENLDKFVIENLSKIRSNFESFTCKWGGFGEPISLFHELKRLCQNSKRIHDKNQTFLPDQSSGGRKKIFYSCQI